MEAGETNQDTERHSRETSSYSDDAMTASQSQRSMSTEEVQDSANYLDWHFSQVFGERMPGENVLDGG